MTTLVTSELVTTLNQEVTYSLDQPIYIYGLKMLVVMFNNPAGTFTVAFRNGTTVLSSKTFTSASIKTALDTSNNYAYYFQPIEFDTPFLIERGTYNIHLSSSGYTFNSSSFLGWCKDYENNFIELDESFGASESPRNLTIYTLKNRG
jgi:hypothetical protein